MNKFECKKCIFGKNRGNKACRCFKGYHDHENTTRDCFRCHRTCKEWYDIYN